MSIALNPRRTAGRVHRTWPVSGALFVVGVLAAFVALSWFAVRVANYSHELDVLTQQRDAAVSTAELANARLVEVGETPVPVPTGGGLNP